MRPLSASDAIHPAFERTRDLLFRPFRWGTFFKLAAVAFFAEIGGGVSFNLPGRGSNVHSLPPALLTFIVAFAVIIGLITLVIGLLFLYLGSRLQLVLVELVATRQTYVGPIWRRVGHTTWRWIGLKVLFFVLSLIAAFVLALPIIVYLIAHGTGLRDLPNIGGFFHLHLAAVILSVAAALVVLLVFAAAYTLLRDFAAPHLALEDLSSSDALHRVLYMVGIEPGAVVLYLLLRILLLLVSAIMGEMFIVIAVLLTLIPVALAGGGLWLAMHKAGPLGTAALIGSAVVGGLIFFSWIMCLAIAVFGSIYTFSQAYALYFLGGRYPLLGDLLDRSTPPPAFPYGAAYPPPSHLPQPSPPGMTPPASL